VRRIKGTIKGKRQHLYLVKFMDYTDSHNKGLTIEDLSLCSDLVVSFWDARKESPPRGTLPRMSS